jgi:tetratricopeptide (TPR) repeat protein
MRMLVLLLLVLVPATADANVTNTFLGWSADGTYYVEQQLNDSLQQYVDGKFVAVPVYLFTPTRPDVKPTWPTRLGPYPKRDDHYTIVQQTTLGADEKAALAAVGALVTAPKPAAKGPGGQTLTAEKRGEREIHVITVGDRRLPMRPTYGFLKIEDIYWRPDGGAVAFHARYGGGAYLSRDVRYLVAYDLTRYAAADRKAATALRKAAARYARAKEWESAAEELQEAVNVDPTFVDAHYDLAAAASRRGDAVTVERELTWLAASTDPLAAKALRKAATDRAFDRAAAHAAVRTLLGLGDFAALPLEQRLAGTWTVEGAACDASWLTLTLAARGKASLRVRSACVPEHAREWDRTSTFNGKWTAAPAAHVDLKMRPRDDAPQSGDLDVRSCPDGWCLFLTSGDTTYGPFHRGEPE